MSKESYTGMFKNLSDAIEFENQTLSVGSEFLPEHAKTVRDGGEPTPEYWDWLESQFLSPGGHDFVDATEEGVLSR